MYIFTEMPEQSLCRVSNLGQMDWQSKLIHCSEPPTQDNRNKTHRGQRATNPRNFSDMWTSKKYWWDLNGERKDKEEELGGKCQQRMKSPSGIFFLTISQFQAELATVFQKLSKILTRVKLLDISSIFHIKWRLFHIQRFQEKNSCT